MRQLVPRADTSERMEIARSRRWRVRRRRADAVRRTRTVTVCRAASYLKRARPNIGPPVRALIATVPVQVVGLGQWTRSATVPSERSTIGRRRWNEARLDAVSREQRTRLSGRGAALTLMVERAPRARWRRRHR